MSDFFHFSSIKMYMLVLPASIVAKATPKKQQHRSGIVGAALAANSIPP